MPSHSFSFRKISPLDYNRGYLQLMAQLSIVNPQNISYQQFHNFIYSLGYNHQIVVIEEINSNKIVGSITMIFEQKLIHDLGMVCHIEDVVTDKEFRGNGLGKALINFAIKVAKEKCCYKIILDCNEDNSKFYEKCGFHQKEKQMALYLEKASYPIPPE